MARTTSWFSIAVISVLLLAGCREPNAPVLADYPHREALGNHAPHYGPLASSVTTSTIVSGYLVEFDGRVFAGDQTTFSYTVSGSGTGPTSTFFLELPDCAPAVTSTRPSDATIGVDPLIDIYGVRFHVLVGPNESQSYSVVFPGDVPLGVIRASVHAGEINEIGEIAGPCGGFEISGTVYVDADSDGVQTVEELGIANVTVRLDDGGQLLTATTDANGDYTFLKLAGGYTVRIDAATAEEDMNETLVESFEPTGPTSRAVTVGPDSLGNNFGYHPQQQKIILELETGVLQTDGQPVRFWKRQVRAAISGSTRGGEFSAAQMAQFITEIQGLFLPEPFQFTPGNEFEEALEILSTRSQDPLQQLLRELLAAEFNKVSGKGLIGEVELQEVLLKWAEALVAEGGIVSMEQVRGPGAPQAAGGTGNVADALKILELMNGSTGGGSGGGG